MGSLGVVLFFEHSPRLWLDLVLWKSGGKSLLHLSNIASSLNFNSVVSVEAEDERLIMTDETCCNISSHLISRKQQGRIPEIRLFVEPQGRR